MYAKPYIPYIKKWALPMPKRLKDMPTALQRKIREMMGDEDWHPAQEAPPPFESLPIKERARRKLTPLMEARRTAEMLAGWYRDDVFDSWVRVFLVPAEDPRQWTQARVLYEHYVKAASLKEAGGAKSKLGKHARQEIASETQWGLMMATKFIKKRRTRAFFYPVRLKRDV